MSMEAGSSHPRPHQPATGFKQWSTSCSNEKLVSSLLPLKVPFPPTILDLCQKTEGLFREEESRSTWITFKEDSTVCIRFDCERLHQVQCLLCGCLRSQLSGNSSRWGGERIRKGCTGGTSLQYTHCHPHCRAFFPALRHPKQPMLTHWKMLNLATTCCSHLQEGKYNHSGTCLLLWRQSS